MRSRRPTHHRLRGGLGAAIASLALFAMNISPASAADEAAWLFDPGAVVEVDLGLPQASIEALEVEPDEYQPATFTLKAGVATYGPYSVGARLKGSFGSFRPLSSGKSGFKVKFDEYVDDQVFLGLEKLTLNNMVQDPSMVHETMAYELFRTLGVPAPRTGYAFVRVNDEDFGVYLNVETLDLVSLARWYASTRHLYEGQVGLDVSPGSTSGFEVDEGKSKQREDLDALILAANGSGGDWSDGMAAVADLGEMTRMWAVERYVGHWDGYAGTSEDEIFKPNNYYLHSVDSGLFQMLPWGTDQTWATHVGFDETAGGLLFNRCLADASCDSLYVDALRAVRAAVAGSGIDDRVAATAALLAPWQQLEQGNSRHEYSVGQIAAAVAAARAFIASRPAEADAWLAAHGAQSPSVTASSLASAPPPVPIADLRVGRVRLIGGTLRIAVSLGAAGVVAHRVQVATPGGWRTFCGDRVEIQRARDLSLPCQLPPGLRRRLHEKWLALRVVTSFAPAASHPESVTRHITLPRN